MSFGGGMPSGRLGMLEGSGMEGGASAAASVEACVSAISFILTIEIFFLVKISEKAFFASMKNLF